MSIQSNLNTIKASLPEHVTLVAVSKTKPVSDLNASLRSWSAHFWRKQNPGND